MKYLRGIRRDFLLDIVDSLAMLVATYLALYIRNAHFGTSDEVAIFPVLSAMATFLIFYLSGANKHLIRYFSLREFLFLAAGMGLAVVAATFLAFLAFRLNEIPRGVPVLQWLLAVGSSAGLRIAYRLWHGSKQLRIQQRQRTPLLIIGNTPATEVLLRMVELLGRDRYQVVGILDENPQLHGNRIRGCEILGHPHNLSGILLRLRIHGVSVRHVLLADDKQAFSQGTLRVIDRLRDAGLIEVEELREKLLQLLPAIEQQEESGAASRHGPCHDLPEMVLAEMEDRIRIYGPRKRVLDMVGAAGIGLCALPLLPVIFLLLWLNLGRPFLFWQERVGQDGRMVRIYKFRTMRMPQGTEDLDDAARQCWVGNLLRRLHLDELPQLYNILKGDMSFIGPRPLLPVDLPVDMPECLRLRAMLRPGLTGWAQIHGGKEVPKEDKVILDLWYLKNMSLKLDMRILLLTLRTVIFGHRLDPEVIRQAYNDLGLTAAREGASAEKVVFQ